MIRDELFLNVEKSRLAHEQWKRFLPIFIKTQFSLYKSENAEFEFPIIEQHNRFNIMGPIAAKCKRKFEVYGTGDEGKRVCGLKQLKEINKAVRTSGQSECVVFSIGSNNQWNFEESVFNRTGCSIEVFDCTVAESVQPPKYMQPRVRLHRVCLGDQNIIRDGRQYVRWVDAIELAGLQTAPTYLKMDIEGYEFPLMRDIIDGGVFLPLQISMEVHLVRHERNKPDWEHRVGSFELHTFFDNLFEFGGYHLVHRRENPFCAICSEIVLARLDCHSRPLGSEGYRALFSQSDNYLNQALAESAVIPYYE